VIAVMKLPTGERRMPIDLPVGLLTLLVVWEAISMEQSEGTDYLLHVIPSISFLVLAVAARGPITRMSRSEIRFATAGVLLPLCCFLMLGWIAQYAHFVPSTNFIRSGFPLSIHGFRLQGLTSAPNGLGFLAALVTLIAFVAPARKFSWFTRAVGMITLLASDSRTSMIALGVGLFTLWVLGPGRNLTKRMMALLFLVLASVGAWGIIDIQRTRQSDILSDRDVIWRDLIPYLHQVPTFGYGPNIFLQLAPRILGPYTPYGQVVDPQNQWLNDSLEFGLAAAAILTLFLVVMLLRGPLLYRRQLLLPLVMMVLVEGLSEVPLAVFSSIDGVFPLFLLLMWAPLRPRRRLVQTRLWAGGVPSPVYK
jgi:hypothetical protein